ncbi:MAG: hypothetical protein KF752_17795 [Pirellulaceae bacterium]|nr:hypothetical protein [Pirellulaceae bacterium]
MKLPARLHPENVTAVVASGYRNSSWYAGQAWDPSESPKLLVGQCEPGKYLTLK